VSLTPIICICAVTAAAANLCGNYLFYKYLTKYVAPKP
jgi:hypothetical protein